MRASRLLLLVVALGVGAWLYLNSSKNLLQTRSEDGSASTPLERARKAAAESSSRSAETTGAQAASDAAAPGAGVTENMTPDQVRALLGAPTETSSETLESGVKRETWTYRDVGKSVIFENGVVTSIR
ncbi:MAG TPA: hypothetical protein VE007_05405 [Thermoanaerobaculia bacterium]|nr:hypothetical protein [Thermoanaerobaculia bacterium]